MKMTEFLWIFDEGVFEEICERSLDLGFSGRRQEFKDEFPLRAQSVFPQERQNNDSTLLNDLRTFNRLKDYKGEFIPLKKWLKVASRLAESGDDTAFFESLFTKFDALPKKPLLKRSLPKSIEDHFLTTFKNEKVNGKSDLKGIDFLNQGLEVGGSVFHLNVPVFQDGRRVGHAEGSGWLIGPKHVITNHHVISGRREEDEPASEADLKKQIENTVLLMDFDRPAAADTKQINGMKLYAYDVQLDYAILELDEPLPLLRKPLTLQTTKLVVNDKTYIMANIIQHPNGKSKQICFRNNLIVESFGNCIGYFTDTDVGSSGSPVCDDNWNVLALHRAASEAKEGFEFQGLTGAYINIGTRIDLLIADLQEKRLWDAVRARTV